MRDAQDMAAVQGKGSAGAEPVSGQAAGKKKQGSSERSRKRWSVVFVVAIAVLVASLVALGLIAFSYVQGQQKYEKLEQQVSHDTPAGLTVDWDALKAINGDAVAWLYQPNTAVNYPMVRGADNDYYLTHDFYGEEGWLATYGAIFMDYRNNPNWTDDLYFIYGHHMNDGSMFADVAGMQDQARFDECRTVYLLSPQGNFTLRTFAFVRCAPDEEIVQTTFATREDEKAYLQDKLNRSLVDPGSLPDVGALGPVFAFATCDNLQDGRYILYAYVQETTAQGLEGSIGSAENAEGEGGAIRTDLQTE